MRRGKAALVGRRDGAGAVRLRVVGRLHVHDGDLRPGRRSPSPSAAVVGGDPLTLRTPQGVVHGTTDRRAPGRSSASPSPRRRSARCGGGRRSRPPAGRRRCRPPTSPPPAPRSCPSSTPSRAARTACTPTSTRPRRCRPAPARPGVDLRRRVPVGSSTDDTVANYGRRRASWRSASTTAWVPRVPGPAGPGRPGPAARDREPRPARPAGRPPVGSGDIAAYGGDPGQVTIYGESAGGMSVCAQLVSPASGRPLRAGHHRERPLHPARTAAGRRRDARGRRWPTALGCPPPPGELACMRSRPAEQVIGPCHPTRRSSSARAPSGARWPTA